MSHRSASTKVKRRIAEYLEDIAAKEGREVEVKFVKKKIAPGIRSTSILFGKKAHYKASFLLNLDMFYWFAIGWVTGLYFIWRLI